MLTEKEAKTKWCPYALTFGRVSQAGKEVATGPQNRGYQMDAALVQCLCLTSDCMMWRWARAVYRVTPNPIGTDARIPPEQVQINAGEGYCGLTQEE